MSYLTPLREHNEASQAMATERMLQAWMSSPKLSVRKLATVSRVSTATSRRFIQALRCPTTTVICKVKDGFSCSCQGRIYKAGQHLQLSVSEYQQRQMQVRVLCLRQE